MRTDNIPLCYIKSKRSLLCPDRAVLSTLIGSNYPCLELIYFKWFQRCSSHWSSTVFGWLGLDTCLFLDPSGSNWWWSFAPVVQWRCRGPRVLQVSERVVTVATLILPVATHWWARSPSREPNSQLNCANRGGRWGWRFGTSKTGWTLTAPPPPPPPNTPTFP